MPCSVLVTGAAGFIGSHLAEHCLERGWDVTAVDSFTGYYDESLKRRNISKIAAHPGCTLIESDLLDLDLDHLLEGIDVVYHLAAQPGVRASWDEFDVYLRLNLAVTQRLLHVAAHHPIDRFVLASSSSVYGNAETMPTSEDLVPQPVSPYGMTKAAVEHLAHVYFENFGVPTVALRYFTVYGPRQRPDMAFNRLIAKALDQEPFAVFGDGEQTRDFTFVEDAVDGTLAAGRRGRPGTVYNIGGGSRRSMNSVFTTLEKLLGVPVLRVYGDQQPGDARDTAADISRAQRDLGYRPRVEFSTGLHAQLRWQREQVSPAAEGAGRLQTGRV